MAMNLSSGLITCDACHEQVDDELMTCPHE